MSKSYVDFLENESLATSNTSLVSFYIWGDWCSMQNRVVATKASGPPLSGFNYIMSLDAMSKMANVLGKKDDAERYQALAAKLRAAWHTAYFNEAQGLYGYAAQDGFACQTLTAAPLAMGNVVPEKLLDGLLANLKNDVVNVRSLHQTFGSVGAKHFFSQLSNHGMHKEAMEVATQDTYPSFGYWIKNGATTCWENWSGVADPMHPPQPVSC